MAALAQHSGMTKWRAICVPYHHRRHVRNLGCVWDYRLQLWCCNSTQFRHKSFKQYRTKQFSTTQVHISFKEVAPAKSMGCRWLPAAKQWAYDLPDDDTLIDPWIRDRLAPPVMDFFRVPYELRDVAKAAGARFDFGLKLWCLPARERPHSSQLQPYAVVPKAGAAATQPISITRVGHVAEGRDD